MQFIKNKKLISMVVLTLMLLLVLSGCKSSKEEAVAIVNGKAISKLSFDINFDINRAMYEGQLGPDIMSKDIGNGRTFEEELRQVVLDNLITEELILQEAEKEKITVTEEELKEAIDQFVEAIGGEEGLEEFLSNNNMTEEFMNERMELEMIIDKYRDNFFATIISDEDLRAQYEENSELFESVRASHILVETEEEARDILDRINSGESFEDLTSLSIEPNAEERKGDLGYFTRGQMVSEFSEAAFSLNEPGEISDIVQTDVGYHIIKLTDKKTTFEDVKDDVFEYVQNLEYDKFVEKLESLKDSAVIEILMEFETEDAQDNSEEGQNNENQDSEDESEENTDNENE